MRTTLVTALMLIATSAVADPKAIENAVRTNLVELAKQADDSALALTSDAIVVHVRGDVVDMTEREGCVTGAVANAMYGCLEGDIKHTPGKITSSTLGDVGWFVAPFVVAIKGSDPDGNPVKTKATHRAGGIVVKQGDSWRLASVIYVEPVADKVLLRSDPRELPKGDAKLSGDKQLAAAVASWFKSGFAASAAKQGTLVAAGTAPAELKTGAAAGKLAKAWDKLKLTPVSIDAKLVAGGKIGWAFVDVRLPKKGSKTAVAMQLAVIAIPDGDGWRWVSLMYQPPFEPGR